MPARVPLHAPVALLLGASASAQMLAPDPHWGASTFPIDTPELRLGLGFNRFTEFSGTGTEFGNVQESAGFNLLSYSYTDRLDLWRRPFTFTVAGGAGNSGEQPTEFIQNDLIHDVLLDQREVRVGRSRDEFEAFGSLTVDHWWFEDDLATDVFAGVGALTGTLYHESFAHVGATHVTSDWGCKVGALYRAAFPVGGDAYPDVEHFNQIAQVQLGYVPSGERWIDPWLDTLLGSPEIAVIYTYDAGFFEDRTGEGISTRFISFQFAWKSGLSLEIWNDFANGTDFGPTGGGRVGWDLSTLFQNLRPGG